VIGRPERNPDIRVTATPRPRGYPAGVPDSARGLILVVEDEPAIADVIRMNLAKAGYGVALAEDGAGALDAVRRLRPAAILLDVGLPGGMDGIEVCRRLRAGEDWTPVLFVTARDDEIDRILGLELGADDYVTKPFSPRELVARVTSVLRRARGVAPNATLQVGQVRLDPEQRRVVAGGREVALTVTEFDLLAFLMRRPGRIFPREQLLSEVWGYSAVAGTRTVDVHIAQLRAKLGAASPVRTVRGVGYGVDATPDAAGSP
jgi:DNA-binding response OmpR family regulator